MGDDNDLLVGFEAEFGLWFPVNFMEYLRTLVRSPSATHRRPARARPSRRRAHDDRPPA